MVASGGESCYSYISSADGPDVTRTQVRNDSESVIRSALLRRPVEFRMTRARTSLWLHVKHSERTEIVANAIVRLETLVSVRFVDAGLKVPVVESKERMKRYEMSRF